MFDEISDTISQWKDGYLICQRHRRPAPRSYTLWVCSWQTALPPARRPCRCRRRCCPAGCQPPSSPRSSWRLVGRAYRRVYVRAYAPNTHDTLYPATRRRLAHLTAPYRSATDSTDTPVLLPAAAERRTS